jgi:16S rRNA (guanine966-N2)-methyltransferase
MFILRIMRIIAGKWKGCRIAAPAGEQTRPILDRAKTVLFDMIGHRLDEPGRLPPIAVLDLFAGSGGLGLEALSRGAAYALLVERGRKTAALIRQNLDHLQIVSEAHVVEADATSCTIPPPPGEVASSYGLVFLDPPYRMLTGPVPDVGIRELARTLSTDPVIAPTALIVVRHAQQRRHEPDLSPLLQIDRRDVGKMTLRFMTPCREGSSEMMEDG